MYLHNERNHAWPLGCECQTRFAHRVGCLAPKAPPELAINNMRALPLNVNGSPSLRQKPPTCFCRDWARAKASYRSGSAYGVIFRTSATPFGSALTLVSSHAYSVTGLVQDHIGRPIIVRFIRAAPTRRIDLRRQCIVLVAATGAVDTYKSGAQARAMVGHACGAPRPGCDLTALDPIRPRLCPDHYRQDCDCVKKLEFGHSCFSRCC